MAFQYAHHRPLTPITPVHSPHPSAGSSVRARTPGQLSLHEYRKMQVTPSPPAVPGQKTVKKKRGMSSLNRPEGSHAQTPKSDFFSSFPSMTTPPETPSLDPPLPFTSNVLPADATPVSRVEHSSAATRYPEFAHLLSLGSEIQHSPPKSKTLLSLHSTLPSLQSSSSYKAPAPKQPSVLGLSPPSSSSSPLRHPLLESQLSLRRPWSSTEGQDLRYVSSDTDSQAPSRIRQQSRFDGSSRAESADIIRSLGRHFQQPDILGSSFPGTSVRESFPGIGSTRNNFRPLSTSATQESTFSQPKVKTSQPLAGASHSFEPLASAFNPRERHFNSIKRLPRPHSSGKRRPVPLSLTTSNTDGLYQSENYTTSTSSFSLSKYSFPQPPQPRALSPHSHLATPPLSVETESNVPRLPAESPLLRFSGVSFEIVNPHSSLELANFDSLSDEVEDLKLDQPTVIDYDSDSSEMGSDGKGAPIGKRFSSFRNAYESISKGSKQLLSGGQSRRSSSSRARSTSQPTTPITPPRLSTGPTPANTPPWVGFNEHGQRVNAAGEVVTDSIQAGPRTSQADLVRASMSSRSTPTFSQSLEYPEPVFTSNIPLPSRARSNTLQPLLESSPILSADKPALALSLEHDVISPAEDRVDSLRCETTTRHLHRSQTRGSRSVTFDHTEGAGFDFGLPVARQNSLLHDSMPIAQSNDFSALRNLDHGVTSFPRPAIKSQQSALRQPIYESDLESHRTVAGGQNFAPDRSTGETRYSQATSVDDLDYPESSCCLSEPFPYANYESRATGQSSTLSRFIQEYDYTHGDQMLEPSRDAQTIHYELSPHSSYVDPAWTEATNEIAPSSTRSASAADRFVTMNGREAINGRGPMYGVDLGSRVDYPRFRGQITRAIPVRQFNTVEDFDEAIEDMAHQPLLHRSDTEFLERYHALMSRICELHGIEARRAAERKLNHVVPAPQSAFDHQVKTQPTGEYEDYLYMAPVAPLSYQDDESESEESERSPLNESPGSSIAPLGPLVVRNNATHIRDSREFARWLEEDSDTEQHSAEIPQSPLDNSLPRNPLDVHGAFLHNPDGARDQVQGIESSQLAVDRVRSNSHRFGWSGPPPQDPAPCPSNNEQSIGFITPPRPFANRNPAEQSEVSSYDSTKRLLGIINTTAPRSPDDESYVVPRDTANLNAQDQSSASRRRFYMNCQALRHEEELPRMWARYSPPGSANLRQKRTSNEATPSQTSEEIAAAIDDADDWETEPSRSNRNSYARHGTDFRGDSGENSILGGYYAFPTKENESYGAGNDYTPAHPLRPNDSHLPGFYPVEELSPEPHDDFENLTTPPKAVIRQSHRNVIPKQVYRYGHNFDDIELGVLSPRSIPSVRSDRSSRSRMTRWPRPSVQHQNTIRPFMLRSNTQCFDSAPTLQRKDTRMTVKEKRIAYAVNWFCITIGAIIPIPSLLFCLGFFDGITRECTSRKLKKIALWESAVMLVVVLIAAAVCITISAENQRRASGN
ncbi:uncharacterized protein PV09_06366 [Verruconis gallopava]|uniref:Uncharacterized protein n=1 Tax=Verruconis gallopava TaxID=253628 RepID=A0A0D2A6K7_9PEZI|nr:uncharacterized protein PV09_06366 [Verruconis gallopava]KIW02210.1 hypothetical protein PV09_06366 [Verruconis gallopava]